MSPMTPRRPTKQQETFLKDLWVRSSARMEMLSLDPSPTRFQERQAQRRWINKVLALDVEIEPGRAIVTDPRSGLRVEMQWMAEGRDAFWLGRFDVRPPPGLVWRFDELERFAVAAHLHAAVSQPEKFTPIPRARPQAGRPLDTGFYTSLLATYEEIRASGHRAPAKELARRMNENPNTVKSWLKRGREALREEGK